MNVAAAIASPTPGLTPFSLKDAPSFIERQLPVGRLSAEAYKERKAGAGQTLTALGSYWKGRKPLILVRAVVLGSLLPASDDAAADLELFLKLMAMDDAAFGRRFDGGPTKFATLFPAYAELVTEERGRRRVWRDDLSEDERQARVAEAFATLPYSERLKHVRRPEECHETELLEPIWSVVNRHLGTTAQSLPELVEQLGVSRFGHRPKLADTFCGGGSIPFEAARMGCDVYASDLNPIACMLTWGAFNIIGASKERRAKIEAAQRKDAEAVDAEITRLGIEHDADGNRAKAYLYCLEARCPRTDWMVPMAPSWIISRTRNVVAKLVPNHATKCYEIEIHSGVSAAEMAEAAEGTVRDGRLVHPMNPERSGVEIKTIRGDYRDADGNNRNRLRLWGKSDVFPQPDDIFRERLYCIQWITNESLGDSRPKTFFAAVTDEDLARERKVEAIVRQNLAHWQSEGLAADMLIEPGEETTRLFRERGWTHWINMFVPRHILILALFRQQSREPESLIPLSAVLNFTSRLTRWAVGSPGKPGVAPNGDFPAMVFSNQALNTFYNYAERAFFDLKSVFEIDGFNFPFSRDRQINTHPAEAIEVNSDIFVTDPPYADAVNYHEITEFFIGWLRRNPPPPFDQWTWDSRRNLAIKGKDEHFRRDMVAAYAAMTRHMPDNGLQVVMFTHQNAGVWADLGAILWAAGLSVTAAWNVVTETESALKEGNYVQGTVCLVLRKRLGEANARRMEIEAEIEEAVAAQLARLTALDDSWHERTHAETLYTDGDLTLAAYAAALQVVTAYATIDRQPLDRDLYRKLARGETTMLRELIGYAESVANNLLVPAGFPREMWRDLTTPERFYVRMLDMEAKGSAKVADFQNFARSFAFGGYAELMASTTANAAALAGAADFKGRMLADNGDSSAGFAASQVRQLLFAIWKTMEGGTLDPKRGVTILKTEYAADYWQRRQKLIALASYIALKTNGTRQVESIAAHELAEALKLDRV
ncbi:putative DNA methylase [Bradyrhizobium japonicum]